MTTSKSAQLDAKLLELIGRGTGVFGAIAAQKDVIALAEPLTTEKSEPWRIVDRRLQALRKAGKISFSRKNDKWELKK